MIAIDEIEKKYGIEIALVLLCCRVHFKTESIQNLQAFIDEKKIDWQYVQTLASYHRIEPLVFKILSALKVPETIHRQIKQKQHQLIQQSFRNALETERIIHLLKQNGIDCLPYKGVAFSKQFYGDIISRESSDIDLVISPDAFEKVISLMCKDGYYFESRVEYEYLKHKFKNYTKEINFNKFENDQRIFHIEFHWKISDNRIKLKKSINEILYVEGLPDTLAREMVKMMGVHEHYVAVFVHHSMNDGFSVLRNIIDLATIANEQNREINHLAIQRMLLNLKLSQAAKICSIITSDILGLKIPLFADQHFYIGKNIKQHFTDQLLHEKMIGYHFQIKPINKNILLLRENISEKIKYLIGCMELRFTPSPKDFRTFNLPRGFYFLYFIIKPFRSLFNRVNTEEAKQIAKSQK